MNRRNILKTVLATVIGTALVRSAPLLAAESAASDATRLGFGSQPTPNRELVKSFDKDGDGRLNREERQEARAFLKREQEGGRGRPGGFGGFRRRGSEPPKPGPRIAPADIETNPDASLYEPGVLRTVFLEFEHPDWEAELEEFHHTDVEVPAKLLADGRVYSNVGVKFRGTGSFNEVATGQKRSLTLKLDSVEKGQSLYGYTTLNLNNAFQDPAFMNSTLYAHIARQYVAAPKVNYVRLVINGESWGVYINAQKFDKKFLKESFESFKGVRWNVPANRFGTAAMTYLGEDIEQYKRQYEMKTDDGDKAWKDLVALCRTLNETPVDKLAAALGPVLDIDGALWFLAIENVLMNNDGYWSKGSDFNLFRDHSGKFHVIIHDTNESFGPISGPGPARSSRARRVDLDPLVGLEDFGKPLRARLLAVPELREQYLRHVRTIAEEWLDWRKLGPLVEAYRALIDSEVRQDTWKLYSYEEFVNTVAGQATATQPATTRTSESSGRSGRMSLQAFAEQRREYVLNHPEIRRLSSTGDRAGK